MLELNPIRQRVTDLTTRVMRYRGIFDYERRKERLEEVTRELAPEILCLL